MSFVVAISVLCRALVREISQVVTEPVAFHQRRQIGQLRKFAVNHLIIGTNGRQIIGVQAVGHVPFAVDDDDVFDPFF